MNCIEFLSVHISMRPNNINLNCVKETETKQVRRIDLKRGMIQRQIHLAYW